MEQTKGYLRLKGKVWGLDKAEAKVNETGSIRSLSFRINTEEDNSLFIQVGKWANTSLTIKVKGDGMEKVEEFNEQNAINKIKEVFKDGDSIYVNCRAEVNVFTKKIDYLVNQIYIEKEPINFKSDEFTDTNELKIPIIITERCEGNIVKAGVTDYKGNIIELELSLEDEVIENYFKESVKVGDLIRSEIKIVNKPNYTDKPNESETNEKGRMTLKGKIIEQKQEGRRSFDGYISKLEIVDIDTEASTPKKYTREEIREALESQSQQEIKDNKVDKKIKEDDTDLPF